MSKNFDESAFSTKLIAADIVGLIRSLGIQNYVLFGHSYGSAVATVAASIAEEQGLSAPQAIVLSGVVGHGYGVGESSFSGFTHEWSIVMNSLPTPLAQLFTSGPLPLVDDKVVWGTELMQRLTDGADKKSIPDPLATDLINLYAGDKGAKSRLQSELSAIQAEIGSTDDSGDADSNSVYHIVYCSELANEASITPLLDHGELVADTDASYCAGIPLNRYDSGKWLTRTPLFYFSGDHDPVMPLWQARYHYKNQTRSSKKSFVVIKDGGHGAVFDLFSCRDKLWKSIIDDNISLGDALRSCIELNTT